MKISRFRCCSIVSACLASMAVIIPAIMHAAEGDQPANSKAAPSAIKNSGWQPIFKGMAEDYRISPADEPDRLYKLQLPPVFRWAQPVRGGDDGAVFLWLRRAVQLVRRRAPSQTRGTALDAYRF